ncbi:hypothetical protein SRABI03_02779 [Microbacterium foliorum]|nr:hypothetical protein SRABI03_02779 [Microbacterium foliorum]
MRGGKSPSAPAVRGQNRTSAPSVRGQKRTGIGRWRCAVDPACVRRCTFDPGSALTSAAASPESPASASVAASPASAVRALHAGSETHRRTGRGQKRTGIGRRRCAIDPACVRRCTFDPGSALTSAAASAASASVAASPVSAVRAFHAGSETHRRTGRGQKHTGIGRRRCAVDPACVRRCTFDPGSALASAAASAGIPGIRGIRLGRGIPGIRCPRLPCGVRNAPAVRGQKRTCELGGVRNAPESGIRDALSTPPACGGALVHY